MNKDFDLLLIVIGVNFFFILGFLDDKYNLNANLKLLISALFVFFIISISQNLKLEHLYSELFSKKYVIKSFSPYFTTLCILLLINAVNLADGINSLVNNIVTIWLINLVLVFGLNLNFSIFVIIFFLILNSYFIFKNYYFLGDSGTLSLGFFISLITIYSYNQNLYLSFSLEDMFLIFMIPGIDMFRLFIKRIIKKTNPFSGDKNHLHHILLNKFGLLKANLIYVLFIIFPLIMNNFFTDFTIIVIIISLITYEYFLTFKKKFF